MKNTGTSEKVGAKAVAEAEDRAVGSGNPQGSLPRGTALHQQAEQDDRVNVNGALV
jgi:hypothetical protein